MLAALKTVWKTFNRPKQIRHPEHRLSRLPYVMGVCTADRSILFTESRPNLMDANTKKVKTRFTFGLWKVHARIGCALDSSKYSVGINLYVIVCFMEQKPQEPQSIITVVIVIGMMTSVTNDYDWQKFFTGMSDVERKVDHLCNGDDLFHSGSAIKM